MIFLHIISQMMAEIRIPMETELLFAGFSMEVDP